MLAATGYGTRLLETVMLDLKEADEFLARQHLEGLQQGLQQGLQRGRVETLAKVCARRLGRPLDEREVAGLRARVVADADAVADAVLDLSPDALRRWLSEG